jgi:hypothetical protein
MGRPSPGNRGIPTRPRTPHVRSARALRILARRAGSGTSGPAVGPITPAPTPPARPATDRISGKILKAPKSFLSKAARDMERGDPGFRGVPLPQELQPCVIMLVDGIGKACAGAWGFGGVISKIACKQLKYARSAYGPVTSLQSPINREAARGIGTFLPSSRKRRPAPNLGSAMTRRHERIPGPNIRPDTDRARSYRAGLTAAAVTARA